MVFRVGKPLDERADRSVVAEDDHLIAVLNSPKPAITHLTQKRVEPAIPFDVSLFAADHLSLNNRLAVKDVADPDFGREGRVSVYHVARLQPLG